MKISFPTLRLVVAMGIIVKAAFAQLGDWEPCTASSQCKTTTACCTGQYSGGVLKCTPLAAGYSFTSNGCVGSPPQAITQPAVDAVTSTKWSCYQASPIIYKGSADTTGSHQVSDGIRACNAKYPVSGGCSAIKFSTTYQSGTVKREATNNCVGNGGTCTAVYNDNYSITIGSFRNDDTFEQVMGCGGAFSLTSAGFGVDGKTVSADVGFTTSTVYKEWEGCCAAAGESLEQRGLLSSGWRCAKDANWMATKISLISKNRCWGSNTRCGDGTTCNYCCNGYYWHWWWAGHHCH